MKHKDKNQNNFTSLQIVKKIMINYKNYDSRSIILILEKEKIQIKGN